MNFRESLCAGYFDEPSDFSHSLAHQCPRISLPDRATYTDACIRLVESVSTCRAGQPEQFTDARCRAFMEEHMSYAGCVRDHRDRSDFYLSRWLVWMHREQEFFRNLTEHVTLREQNGKTVAEHDY